MFVATVMLINKGWGGFAESSGRTGRVIIQNLFCCSGLIKLYILYFV
jgi:hypothetical protein